VSVVCKSCKKQFKEGAGRTCPHCGETIAVTSGVVKTSTIFVAAEGTEAVYHSVKELPEPLRKKLLKTTNGANSATILIADRRGKEEITKALRKLPAPQTPDFLSALLPESFRVSPQQLMGVALALAALLIVWLVFARAA